MPVAVIFGTRTGVSLKLLPVDSGSARCLYLSIIYKDESVVLVVGAVDSWITARFVPGIAVFSGGILWTKRRGFPRAGAGFPPVDLWISSAGILIPNLSRSYPRFYPGYTATLHTICAYYPQRCPHPTHRPIPFRPLAPGRRRSVGPERGGDTPKGGCDHVLKSGWISARNRAAAPLLIHKG